MRASNEERNAMLALIKQWELSGMRQKDFYQQHNIPAHVFYYWHKCYKNQRRVPVNQLLLQIASFNYSR